MLNSHIIHSGLALAAVFGWLLSFPMFGHLLLATAAEQAPLLGLIFAAAHGSGLIIFSLLPGPIANHRYNVPLAGVTLLALTVTYAFYEPGPDHRLIFSLLGLATAIVVLAWTARFTALAQPLPVLAIAMIGANLVVAVTGIPGFLPAKPVLLMLAFMAAAGIIYINQNGATAPGKDREPGEARNENDAGRVKPFIFTLGAFAIATFFAGGIWYSTLSEQFYLDLPIWRGLVDSLIYCGAIVVLTLGAMRLQPGLLAHFSLIGLGTGLLAALMCIFAPEQPAYRYSFHFLMLTGLAAADLFYWYGLWVVGQVYGGRRAFGLGLGFSLLLIAFSVIFTPSNLVRPLLYNPHALILGTAILILMTPLILRRPLLPAPAAGAGSTPAKNKAPAESRAGGDGLAQADRQADTHEKSPDIDTPAAATAAARKNTTTTANPAADTDAHAAATAAAGTGKDKAPGPDVAPQPVQPTAVVSTGPTVGTNGDEPVDPPHNLPDINILTPAEKRIYLLLLQSIKDTEMAERLQISRHTVKFHVRNILRKYKVANRNELLSLHLAQEQTTNKE